MPRKISNQVRSKAVGLYRTGMTMREVAEEVGISQETVRRFVQEAGVTPRPRGRVTTSGQGSANTSRRSFNKQLAGPGRENACKRWSSAEDEILIDAVKSGMELEDAASLLGRTKIAVSGRKYVLMQNGTLTEEDLRFPRPTGIEYQRGESEVVATLEEETEDPTETPTGISDVSLQDLAQIVRDYGVSAQVTLSAKGTEINITTA